MASLSAVLKGFENNTSSVGLNSLVFLFQGSTRAGPGWWFSETALHVCACVCSTMPPSSVCMHAAASLCQQLPQEDIRSAAAALTGWCGWHTAVRLEGLFGCWAVLNTCQVGVWGMVKLSSIFLALRW